MTPEALAAKKAAAARDAGSSSDDEEDARLPPVWAAHERQLSRAGALAAARGNGDAQADAADPEDGEASDDGDTDWDAFEDADGDAAAGGARGQRWVWEFHAGNPLPYSCVVVDEASMLSTDLLARLVAALRRGARLVLVGDPDQLPPVSPGTPFLAAIRSGLLPVEVLREVFRQRASSAIIPAAHQINAGALPTSMDVWRPGSSAPDDVIKAIYSALDSATEPWPTGLSPTHNGPVTFSAPVTADTDIIGLSDNDEDDDDDKDDQDDEDDKDDAAEAATVEAPGPPLVSRLSLASDAVWLQLHDGCQPLQVAAAAREVVERVLLRDGGAEVQEIQVLTPTKKDAAGTHALNALLQPLMNPEKDANGTAKPAVPAWRGAGAPTWRVGDRVVQTANDYQRLVSNGDIGILTGLGESGSVLNAQVAFDPRPGSERGQPHVCSYTSRELLDSVQHAFAITVHKGQGGEFPAVLVALPPSSPMLLTRQLLYTAVSRASELLILVASRATVEACLRTEQRPRRTMLPDWLGAQAARRGLSRVEPRVFGGGAGAAEGGDGSAGEGEGAGAQSSARTAAAAGAAGEQGEEPAGIAVGADQALGRGEGPAPRGKGVAAAGSVGSNADAKRGPSGTQSGGAAAGESEGAAGDAAGTGAAKQRRPRVAQGRKERPPRATGGSKRAAGAGGAAKPKRGRPRKEVEGSDAGAGCD
ncbi:exodeoxyribonuclease V alpha subunit [Monoraphidium neglectum]|uniref:Exodeoxyribonuclease V alpha subunit n=1 Tax=Monoraphidium neglectum TaxID=145388 RepID=A0A0D2JKA8_9CHLO|nr:exodeoxyribonuclease V alpha subunit [Monoraphidium neglectum]KIY99672.1 exodeoxyribonuclease V alpha subunit [Monoraphidium neglectum]|eukprot:XP_013898692.1 exodeoxyribonuclease V alpha subunit [Monoraphidium neglectum]